MRPLLRLLLTSALILFPAALMADDPFPPYLTVLPVSPDSDDAVRVVTWVECPESGIPTVTRSGRDIRIHFASYPERGCIAQRIPRRTEVPIGTLEPGEWTISVSGYSKGPVSRSIHVRGVAPLSVYPPGVPTEGGMVRVGKAPVSLDRPRVFFGEIEGRVVAGSGTTLEVEAPAHPPGVVDLRVVLENGETFVTPHAFKYYERTGTPDPWVFEPLLFPAAYSGPGAGGSVWRSENAIAPLGPIVVLFEPPCAGCSEVIARSTRIESPSRPEGLVLYVAREAAANVAASSRIRDESRQAETAGTAIPVVRVEEFRHEIVLPDIPAGGESRALLRVWSVLETEGLSIRLRGASRVEYASMPLLRSPNGLAFNTLALDFWLDTFAEDDPVAIETLGARGPYWAMVTLTNEETHQVTTFTPW